MTKTPQGKLNYMYYEMERFIYWINWFKACFLSNYTYSGE